MMISGERTEQLDIFYSVTGFTSDFLSFIDVELIRFFHGSPSISLALCTSYSFSVRENSMIALKGEIKPQ